MRGLESATTTPPHRHHRLGAEPAAQPLWLRPLWWAWTAVIGGLVLVLAIGLPALCVLHCVLDDMHRQSTPHVHERATGAQPAAAQPATLDLSALHHLEPEAVYPAILLPLMLLWLAWTPRRVAAMGQRPLPFYGPHPPLPPPRLH